jgi:hypothetical protein
MKRLLFAALALVLSLGFAGTAQAKINSFVFKNSSSNCAWVTLYSSYTMNPTWSIAKGNHGPRALKPGESFGGPVDWGEVKARAEVFGNANCTGGKVADVDAVYKDNGSANHAPRTGTLQNPNGHYYVTIH